LLIAAEHLFSEVGSPYRQYARDLLSDIVNVPPCAIAQAEALTCRLKDKSLDEIVEWALADAPGANDLEANGV
jgi:hypothetical protein